MWRKKIPFGAQASECFLPVDRGKKSVVLAALNQNVQKWNLFVLFTFNGEFDASVSSVEIL